MPESRRWHLMHHRRPCSQLDDMLKRDFTRGGASVDCLSGEEKPLPQHVSIYFCGFPCNPFSGRHVGTKCFDEEKARPFFAMLDTMECVNPESYILENVEGMATHYVNFEGERMPCVRVVVILLRRSVFLHMVVVSINPSEHLPSPRAACYDRGLSPFGGDEPKNQCLSLIHISEPTRH
eukprot:2688266-Karenia_brevis.AAC.1